MLLKVLMTFSLIIRNIHKHVTKYFLQHLFIKR